jgi:hypothetical protein
LQISFAVFFFALIYAVFRLVEKREEKKVSILTFFAFLISLLFSAPVLLPAIELIQNSARVSQDYDFLVGNLLMQLEQAVMLFAPDIFGNPATRNFLAGETYPTKAAYIGILPLFFSVLGALSFKKNKIVLFFFMTAFLSLVFIIRTPISELFYSFEIPFISTSSPSNMWFIFSLSASILAGFGMQKFLKGDKVVREFFGFCCAFALLLGFAFFSNGENIFIKQLIIPTFLLTGFLVGAFLIMRFKKFRLFFSIALVLLTAAELLYLWHKFNPFSPIETFYPETKVVTFLKENTENERFLGVGQAAILPNLQTQFRLHSPEGYDPLYPKSYGEFI